VWNSRGVIDAHDASDVLVIGGGPAGLAAAKYLVEAGRSVRVLEKRNVLGGKLSSWRDRDGDWLESGLHAFFGGYTTLLAMMDEVGISKNIKWQPHTLTWALPPNFSPRWNGGSVFEEFHFVDAPAPFNGIGAVLSARYIFNNLEKLLFATGTLPVLVRNHAYAELQDDITYEEWHRKRGMTDHMLRTFFAPMALALNFTSVDKISAEALLRVMAYFASSKFASRAGFLDGPPSERLIDPMADFVRARGAVIEATAPAAELLFENGACVGARTRDGREYRAKAVILATPVHDAATLLPAAMLQDPMVSGIAKLESSPVINGHFWFDRAISNYTNLMFSPGTLLPVHADLGQATAGYGYSDGSFIEVCIAPADELLQYDDATIIDRVLADMVSIYPLATREHLVKAKLVRIPKSVYRAKPGAERLRPGTRTPVGNLFLSGCYTNHGFPASLEGAVRSARSAVDGALAVAV
jgi:15-cis-phytoene desaturase